MYKSIDDTGINYHSNYHKIPGNKGIYLDGDYLRQFVSELRPYKSEYDLYELQDNIK